MPLEAFVEPAQHLLPWVTINDLQPGGSGIRAKLHGPDQRFADFLIQRDTINNRLIQAAGIDSPGLTSCLAIGQRVAALWTSQQ
jgi:L-2-hydroxyglutarate oxidase LhgO